jgi:hypothetical protein
MAYQIAFYKLHKKQAPTYEACATRSFWHGRTETIRSATKGAPRLGSEKLLMVYLQRL